MTFHRKCFCLRSHNVTSFIFQRKKKKNLVYKNFRLVIFLTRSLTRELPALEYFSQLSFRCSVLMSVHVVTYKVLRVALHRRTCQAVKWHHAWTLCTHILHILLFWKILQKIIQFYSFSRKNSLQDPYFSSVSPFRYEITCWNFPTYRG